VNTDQHLIVIGDRSQAIAASKIHYLHPVGDTEPTDERFAAFSHAFRDAREVAFFPERFVRIYRRNFSTTSRFRIVGKISYGHRKGCLERLSGRIVSH
jgi:hypothetical protein